MGDMGSSNAIKFTAPYGIGRFLTTRNAGASASVRLTKAPDGLWPALPYMCPIFVDLKPELWIEILNATALCQCHAARAGSLKVS